MKRNVLSLIFVLMVNSLLGSLEFTVLGGIGNLSFDTDKEYSLGNAGETFSPTFYFPVDISLEGNVSKHIFYSFELNRDIILRNRLLTAIGFDNSYFGVKVGPSFGILNNFSTIIKPGISAGLDLRLPGIVFASLRTDYSFGANYIEDGDYSQESSYIALGFWVPYVMVTLSMEINSYMESVATSLMAKDKRTRYQLSAAAHKKFSPYTVDVNLGYQVLNRSYFGRITEEDEIRSLYGGLELRMEISKFFKLIAGGEMPIYTWTESPLKKPSSFKMLYEAYLGFGLTFPNI